MQGAGPQAMSSSLPDLKRSERCHGFVQRVPALHPNGATRKFVPDEFFIKLPH